MGVTIILTTHYIEEAEILADRVGIINQAKLFLLKKNCSHENLVKTTFIRLSKKLKNLLYEK